MLTPEKSAFIFVKEKQQRLAITQMMDSRLHRLAVDELMLSILCWVSECDFVVVIRCVMLAKDSHICFCRNR